jgi:tetratricopeptide (TPR) repeat protein
VPRGNAGQKAVGIASAKAIPRRNPPTGDNCSGVFQRIRIVRSAFAHVALHLTGEAFRALRLRRVAVWVFGKAADAIPGQRAFFLAERGMTYARMKRREDAIRDIAEAIRLAPDEPHFALYMAWAHEELSSPAEAITFYERAMNTQSREMSDSMRQQIRSRVATLRNDK